MNSISILTFTLILLFCSCDNHFRQRQVKEVSTSEQDYLDYKSDFEGWFIDQFPKTLTATEVTFTSATAYTLNRIGLVVSEKNLPVDRIKSVNAKMERTAIGKYLLSDSCLLIVNRFATDQTERTLIYPVIEDSSIVERSCYTGKWPIPNFQTYFDPEVSLIDETTEVYVVEAKQGKYFEQITKANPQMPDAWKNGYAKGLAITKSRKSIVYWSIAW